MRFISKTVFCITVAGGTVAVGQLAYREKQLKSNLPQNIIDIGSKNEKKAIVIGTN